MKCEKCGHEPSIPMDSGHSGFKIRDRHGVWYRARWKGMTPSEAEAHIYTEAEADEIIEKVGRHGQALERVPVHNVHSQFPVIAGTSAVSYMPVLVCRERDGECPNPVKCRADGCPLEPPI